MSWYDQYFLVSPEGQVVIDGVRIGEVRQLLGEMKAENDPETRAEVELMELWVDTRRMHVTVYAERHMPGYGRSGERKRWGPGTYADGIVWVEFPMPYGRDSRAALWHRLDEAELAYLDDGENVRVTIMEHGDARALARMLYPA